MRATVPRSWIFIGLARDLAPGTVRSLDLPSSPRVVFRTIEGAWVVTDAHCPHVGTHLGQGGTVEGDCIRCPLHGLRFDAQGQCRSERPEASRLRLRSHPVVERGGMVFTWLDPNGGEPDYELPELDTTGWRPMRMRTERLELPMEEPLEVHAVDISHNETLHRELDVKPCDTFEVQGPKTHASLTMRHPATPAGAWILRALGVKDGHVETSVEVTTVGLGFQHIRSTVMSMGLVVNQFMLPVPRGANEVDMNVLYSMQQLSRDGLPWALRVLPLSMLEPLFDRAGYGELMAATDEHTQLWTRKRQFESPGFLPGDEDLQRYRAWADSFYAPAVPTSE